MVKAMQWSFDKVKRLRFRKSLKAKSYDPAIQLGG
jgi:hypothetical protein